MDKDATTKALEELQCDLDEFTQILEKHTTRPNVKKVVESWV
jgi:hypothetical protein